MKIHERLKLNEAFPDWKTGHGIFYYLNQLAVPWKDDGIYTYVDIDYHGNHSGEKYISHLVWILTENQPVTSDIAKQLANIIYSKFYRNWQKEYNTLTFDYNPINNYDMTENSTDDTTKTISNTITTNTDIKNDRTRSDSQNNQTFGFNSSSGVPESSYTYTTTNNDTGSNDTTETGSQDTTNKFTHTLTRSGNIGVTTSQQMIQSERELWLYNYLQDTIYPDIDSVLTLLIY